MICIAGCERSVALISTFTFGTVYDAEPRNVVSKGSTNRQFRGSGLSMFTTDSHVSMVERPVVVPAWRFRPCARPRVQRDVDALPEVGPGRAVVGFERHVIVRAPIGRGLRQRVHIDRVAAAAGKPGIARRKDRPLLIIRRPHQRVVGDGVVPPPAPVVADLQRDARGELLRQVDAPLPVDRPHPPALQQVRVHPRRAPGLAEVEGIAGQRAARVPTRDWSGPAPG